MIRKILYSSLIVLVVYACTSEKTTPITITEETAKEEAVTKTADSVKIIAPTELEAGKEIHEFKCERCHVVHDPKTFTKSEWTYWVDKMALKSKLTAEEKEQLVAYLHFYAKED